MKMKTIALGLALCCVSALLREARAQDAIGESASLELAVFAEAAVSNLPAPVLAIIPIRHEDGSRSMEGQLITERLITELSVVQGLRLVERQQLDAALAEQKLAQEGYVSAESAARAGRLTGAKGVLAGTLIQLGDQVEIHARLFSVETGEVVASKKISARRAIKTFISPLWDDIDAIKAKGRKFKARIWTEDDRLRIGDPAQVFFEAERDCYVTVFDFSTDGSITILFPNRFQPDNRVKAGRVYSIPSEDAGYKIRVRGPAGLERLKLLATTEDVPLYVRDYSQSPFSTMNDGDVAAVRGLQATMEDLPDPDWADATWEFLIENVLR